MFFGNKKSRFGVKSAQRAGASRCRGNANLVVLLLIAVLGWMFFDSLHTPPRLSPPSKPFVFKPAL